MKKALLFLTDGFEEIEALSVVDILRRGNVEIQTVSLTGKEIVIGGHDISVIADTLFEDMNEDVDIAILPGGAVNESYYAHEEFKNFLIKRNAAGGKIAAICAAPVFLSILGIAKDKTVVCYPELEEELVNGAILGNKIVEESENLITSKGPATAPYFGLYILEYLKGKEVKDKVYDGMHFELI